jgi:NAD+ kinase
LPDTAHVTVEILDSAKRPVLAVADYTEVRQVSRVEVAFHMAVDIRLMFDPGRGLSERMLEEQFA